LSCSRARGCESRREQPSADSRRPSPLPAFPKESRMTMPAESQRSAHIRLRLNGEEVETSFAPYKTLLEVLREDLGHCGTKHGCELGECGACAVVLDGEPVLSCLVLALECSGRDLRTVEGLSEDNELHPLQAAFADLGATQCGYCTPAFLVTAK